MLRHKRRRFTLCSGLVGWAVCAVKDLENGLRGQTHTQFQEVWRFGNSEVAAIFALDNGECLGDAGSEVMWMCLWMKGNV